jgi:hypothetical protein
MTGSDFLAPETLGKAIKRGKLQAAVTRDAWNRCLSTQVARDKRLDHITLKLTLEIEHVKRKAELFRNSTGVVNVIQGTATRGQRIAILVYADASTLIPQLHREADEFVSLLP